jgi:hypothetical protein
MALNKHIATTHFPYGLGMLDGYCFDSEGFARTLRHEFVDPPKDSVTFVSE